MLVKSPRDAEEAHALVMLLTNNLNRQFEPIRSSMPLWDRQGLHLFVDALKSCWYYDHGNILGASLRSIANTGIILEHRKARASVAA